MRYFRIFPILAICFFFLPGVVFGLSRQGLIRKVYSEMLDRAPTAEEMTKVDSVSFDAAALTAQLNGLPERARAIGAVYQKAVRRRPRPLEVKEWKTRIAPMNTVRKAIFTSDERRAVLTDLFLALLGRYPIEGELSFYNERRVSFEKIRTAISAGTERRDAVIHQFEFILGRAPEDAELQYFITSGQDLEAVGQNSRPVAVAGNDQTVSNESSFVTLDGSASNDFEGSPLTYTWSIVETPPDAVATISDVSSPHPIVLFPASADDPLYHVPGLYRFRLVVSDGQTRSEADEVDVTLLAATGIEMQLLDQINTLRATDNATSTSVLIRNDTLTRVARRYSRYLFVNGWFESIDLDGKTTLDRVRNDGYTGKRVGENIALIKSKVPLKSTKKRVKDIVDGWFASAEHKKNMLKAEYTETGIGFFVGQYGLNDYRMYAVQIFGVPPEVKDDSVKNPPPPVPVSQPAPGTVTSTPPIASVPTSSATTTPSR